MASPIAFIEDKRPDLDVVAELLKSSASKNHWTNFGPVWQSLKLHIEGALDLSRNRTAVPCASGTHALAAAAALCSERGVRRWIVSSYGFRATVVGPFAGATIVDCDAAGLIDLDQVEKLGVSGEVGIVATNPFGIRNHMNEAVAFARRTGAALIVDNAAGFSGFDRSEHEGAFECLSFHHTKPFGFGEGGCLIHDRALESEAMAAMDFGYRGTWRVGGGALSNGKLSDPAAAFILARHLSAMDWAQPYRDQFRRVLAIGEKCGFQSLADDDQIGSGVYGNVPLLSPHAVPIQATENDILVLGKYYKPLGTGEVSRSLYERIVNVPCHPGVAAVSDRALAELLDRVRALSSGFESQRRDTDH